MPRSLHPWGQVSLDEARRFREAYVAAHPKRLDTFLSTLAQAGFDIASVEFTSMVLLDRVWDFAITHLNPAWNIGPDDRPPVEWYPDLDGWQPPPDWPQWDNEQTLTTQGLGFASGLAACASQVILVAWEGQWALSGDGPESYLELHRTFIDTPDGRHHLVEPRIARWYSQFGQDPSHLIWESWEARRNQGPTPMYDPPDVEVERFDDDGEMPNWFHATISPDFTASANTALIDRFIAELLAQRAIADAYRSDTEWVAVKSKRRATEQRIQAIVDKAWQTAKTAHPPVLD